MGVTEDKYRACVVNMDYSYCPSYPGCIYIPANIKNNEFLEVFKFRSKGRVPGLTYYHRKTDCALFRCAQPLPGANDKSSPEDEHLLDSIAEKSRNSHRFCYIGLSKFYS
eukprot:UN18548